MIKYYLPNDFDNNDQLTYNDMPSKQKSVNHLFDINTMHMSSGDPSAIWLFGKTSSNPSLPT